MLAAERRLGEGRGRRRARSAGPARLSRLAAGLAAARRTSTARGAHGRRHARGRRSCSCAAARSRSATGRGCRSCAWSGDAAWSCARPTGSGRSLGVARQPLQPSCRVDRRTGEALRRPALPLGRALRVGLRLLRARLGRLPRARDERSRATPIRSSTTGRRSRARSCGRATCSSGARRTTPSTTRSTRATG